MTFKNINQDTAIKAIITLVCSNDLKAKLTGRWVQPWKYSKMADSSNILLSELNFLV